MARRDLEGVCDRVTVGIEHVLQGTVGVEAIEVAGAVDGEQEVGVEAVLEVLRADRETLKCDRIAVAVEDRVDHVRRDREVAVVDAMDREEPPRRVHAVERAVKPRHARGATNRIERPLKAPVLEIHVG